MPPSVLVNNETLLSHRIGFAEHRSGSKPIRGAEIFLKGEGLLECVAQKFPEPAIFGSDTLKG
jgi:hypothetical protein